MSPHAVHTYCTLCGVGCPSVITVDGHRILSLAADKTHPAGGYLCGKGRASPEIHEHPHRVNYPMRRTRPKSDPDPGWQRITWDEALDLIASRVSRIRAESGSQAIAIGRGTGSGTGLSPIEPWVQRFANFLDTPNYMTNTHLCNWARDGATLYTFGVDDLPLPDVANSGCIVLWGSNPTSTLLSLGMDVTAARARGARLVVIDPRRVGLANKADLHLAVRPGTDAALALAFIGVLIERGWYDDDFVRAWTNAPMLVREDTSRLIRADEVYAASVTGYQHPNRSTDSESTFLAACQDSGELAQYVPSLGRYAVAPARLALRGCVDVQLRDGNHVQCRPAFEVLAATALEYTPELAAQITGVPATEIRDAVQLMVEHRPTSHHAWNGIVQHTNATQTGRAIETFYALLGDWDRKGGNVVPPAVRAGHIPGPGPSAGQAEHRLGRTARPLGPAAVVPGNIAAYDLYTSILDALPYRVRALMSFGGNHLLSSGDPIRGRRAFQQLEFFAQADLFHTPTNAYADVLLPAASFFECEHFIVRRGVAQRRRRATEPLYERRPDVEIIFDLACRLGMREHFGHGSTSTAYDEILAPAGATWDSLLRHPHGLRVSAEVSYQKHAQSNPSGIARGFDTPSRKVELFVDTWAAHGQSPVPTYTEPAESPVRTPDLARDYPLVLTNGKKPTYLHSQHRGVASIRRLQRNPTVEIHPTTAASFGISDGEWVAIETPRARVRAVADLTTTIVPGVVCAYHGWWEACEELNLDGFDPFSEQGANVNLLYDNDTVDPISGAVPHRSSLCRIRRLDKH